MKITDSYEKIFGDKKKIMVVMAHPDDADIMCGGLISRLSKDGKEVRVVKVTSGDKGSRQETITSQELKKERESEDANAMEILGIKKENNIYLELEDGRVEDDINTIGLIAKQIRVFRPDLIICHNPEDVVIRFDSENNWVNHRDHRNSGKSTIDAAYPYSRDLLFFPEQFKDKNVKSHSVSQFLLVDYYGHPDEVFLEVTSFIDERIKAIASHSSQYSVESAKSITDFMTKQPGGKNYERFRYVVAD